MKQQQYHQTGIAEDGESNGHSMSGMGAANANNPLNARIVQDFANSQ